MRANPHRTLCGEEVDQGEPATPGPAPSRQPLGAERKQSRRGEAGKKPRPGPQGGGLPQMPPQHPPSLVLAPDAGASHCSSPTPGLASGRTGHKLCTRSPPSRPPHPAPGTCGACGSGRGHTRCPHVKDPEEDVGPRLKAHSQLCRSESDGPKTSLLTAGPPGGPEGKLRTAGPTARQLRAEPPRAPTPRPSSRALPPWTPPKGVWEGREDHHLLCLQRASTPSSPSPLQVPPSCPGHAGSHTPPQVIL